MSLKAIREYYGVPAERGRTIKFRGTVGEIVGSSRTDMHLRVRLRYTGSIVSLHPTWLVDYLDGKGERLT